jgi:threonyl-tRNA synthetase
MRRIIGEKQPFAGSARPANEAIEYLREKGQLFKVEYCEELAGRGETEIGFYVNGPFEDMCAGPHLQHTGEIPHDCFAVDTLAGAYWRGDEKRPQLTRIYCLAFHNRKELEAYKERRRLAQERDHRKLGKELELFMLADDVGAGLPLWMPKGTVIREALEQFAKETETRYGYQRVCTPNLAKEELYLKSGHLPYYAEDMFPPMKVEGESSFYLRAMNCPHHHLIYGHRPRSYRELPLRLAEFGTVYRYESSGSLSGLLRVRALCQNDAHIYCTPDQVKAELLATFRMTLDYMKKFRFDRIRVRYSTHDPLNSEKFINNPAMWELSERITREVIEESGIEFFEGPGEAAFYGPKIDFQATTLLGREESISTTQLDFGQAINFDLKYVGEDGHEHPVFVVHRAPLGTHERTIAFLIEHFGGAFPTWMAPEQVRIVPVSENNIEYACSIRDELLQELMRVEVDTSSHSFNKKVRHAVTSKIPNILILGAKEQEHGTVTLRRYCVKEQLTIPRQEFLSRMQALLKNRVMDNFADETIYLSST